MATSTQNTVKVKIQLTEIQYYTIEKEVEITQEELKAYKKTGKLSYETLGEVSAEASPEFWTSTEYQDYEIIEEPKVEEPKREVKLISKSRLNKWAIDNLLENGVFYGSFDTNCYIDGLELVTGTGRATCRLTGEKIAKGEQAIKGLYDFTGGGSYTAAWVQISVKAYKEFLKNG